MISLRKALAAAAGISLLAAGCTSQGAPFRGLSPAPSGDYIRGDVVIGKVYDIEGVLQNYSSNPVRLTSLHLTAPIGPGIHMLDVRAYLLNQTGGVGDVDEGNLPEICPKLYKPHPVADVVVAPHSFSQWVVVIEVVFRKPGKYHFGKLQIGYTSAGNSGSQPYYIRSLTLTAIPQSAAPPHLFSPTYCTKYIAPSVGLYDVHDIGGGQWAGGPLYANGNVGLGARISFRLPDGRRYLEKVTKSRWRRSGKGVSMCLNLVAASHGAPATDRICANRVPATRVPVKVTDDQGRTTLLRVGLIGGGSS